MVNRKRVDKNSINTEKYSVAIDLLINKQISQCASVLAIEEGELKAWIDLHHHVPNKTLLHLLKLVKLHQLNPVTEEVALLEYANHEWQAFIGINGWITLINRHPEFRGVSFNESIDENCALPAWIECSIFRSDRDIPTTIREYFCEVRAESEVWKKMPRRMLRHRALTQCARLAFGINDDVLEGAISRKDQSSNEEPKINSKSLNGQGDRRRDPGKAINGCAVLKKMLLEEGI